MRRSRDKSGGDRQALAPCRLPLARQVDGPERATVRRGEHPRASVRRLDLLGDRELDELRARFPERAGRAMDAALETEERLDRALRSQGLDEAALGVLPARPILVVFVCFECGESTVAHATREWSVDRAVRRTGLAERDVQEVAELVRAACGDAAPLGELDAAAVLELHSLLGHDVDLVALRDRIASLRRRVVDARARCDRTG